MLNRVSHTHTHTHTSQTCSSVLSHCTPLHNHSLALLVERASQVPCIDANSCVPHPALDHHWQGELDGREAPSRPVLVLILYRFPLPGALHAGPRCGLGVGSPLVAHSLVSRRQRLSRDDGFSCRLHALPCALGVRGLRLWRLCESGGGGFGVSSTMIVHHSCEAPRTPSPPSHPSRLRLPPSLARPCQCPSFPLPAATATPHSLSSYSTRPTGS